MTDEHEITTPKPRQSIKAGRTPRYDLKALPSEPLPPWTYLVHSQSVLPQKPLGKNGFRAWLTNDRDGLLKCGCHFGGCKNANVHKVHYTGGGVIVVASDGSKRTLRPPPPV
jgi:hypothetical protein